MSFRFTSLAAARLPTFLVLLTPILLSFGFGFGPKRDIFASSSEEVTGEHSGSSIIRSLSTVYKFGLVSKSSTIHDVRSWQCRFTHEIKACMAVNAEVYEPGSLVDTLVGHLSCRSSGLACTVG